MEIFSTILVSSMIITIIVFLVVTTITDLKELSNLKKYGNKLDLEIEDIKRRIKESE